MYPKRPYLTIVVMTVLAAVVIGTVAAFEHSVRDGVQIGVTIIVIIPVGLIAFQGFLALISRWGKLAKRYPGQKDSGGVDRKRISQVCVGSWWFTSGGFVQCEDDGEYLHIWVNPGMNLFMKPVSIPWSEVRSIEKAPFGVHRLEMPSPKVWAPIDLVWRELGARGGEGKPPIQADSADDRSDG